MMSEKKTTAAYKNRIGFTLLEMVIAIGISAILIAAVSSSILLSAKTLTLHDSNAAKSSKSVSVLADIEADLQLALEFHAREAGRVDFSVPDRDGDGLPERIEYTWNDQGDLSLVKSVTLSSLATSISSVVAVNVDAFDLEFLTKTNGELPSSEYYVSDPHLLFVNDDTPEGDGTRILMSVGDSSFPSSAHLTRKALLESWGFTVTLAGYNDSIPDLGQYDALYVAHAMDAGPLSVALQGATLGIVNEQPSMMHELGFGYQGTPSTARTRVHTRNVTHYVMQGLIQGASRLFQSASDVEVISSDPNYRAPSLRVYSEANSSPCIATLEPKDEPFQVAGSVNVGNSSEYSQELSSQQTKQRTFAYPVTVATSGEFSQIQAFVDILGSSSVVFGLYDDQNGQPGTSLASSSQINLNYVQNDAWISGALDPVFVSAGTYWLAITISSNIELHVSPNVVAQTYQTAMPEQNGMSAVSDWSAATSATYDLSIYAQFSEQSTLANRRIQLPWSDDEFSVLSEEGEAVLQRALEWAADTSPEDDAKLFAVDSSSNPMYFFQADNSPSNAVKWVPTRIHVSVMSNPSNPAGKIQFSLYEAIDSHTPGVLLEQTEWISTSQWSESETAWYEIPFQKLDWVDPAKGLFIDVKGATSVTWDAALAFDSTSTEPEAAPAAEEAEVIEESQLRSQGGPFFNNDTFNEIELGQAQSELGAELEVGSESDGGTVPVDPVPAVETTLTGDLRMYVFGRYQTDGRLEW